MFFVSGMLALVVEGLVAAPLWAFFHIRMDGQEFVDQVQRPGYMIAFNLMLRPVLMIFGMILGYVTFGAMLWFVNFTFVPAARSLGESSSVGIVGVIVLIIMMSYIDFQIAMRSFNLITEVPERVSRWFGHTSDGPSDDRHAKDTSNVFIAGMESRMSQTVTGLAGSGGSPGSARSAPRAAATTTDAPAGPGKPGAAASTGSSDGNPTKGA